MSTCSLANTGLPPAQFLSATSVDASQLTILQQSYSSIFGCVRVRSPGSAITSPGSWFCSTPNDITSAGRAAACPVDIVEPACSTPYDIQFNPSGGTVTVSGCLQDIGTTEYYCYSRAQKVACTPRALQGLNGGTVNGNNGNTPILNGEVREPSSQNSSVGVIAGSVVGAVCVAAIGLFFYLRHRRRSQAAMKEISVENAKPRSAETAQHQNAMSEMTLNSIAVAPPQQYNTGSVSSVNGMVRISPERQDGEGLAERMGERPVDEIEGDVVDEIPVSGTPRSSLSSFTFGPPKKPSMVFENVLPPLAAPSDRRSSVQSSRSRRFSATNSETSSVAQPALISSPVPSESSSSPAIAQTPHQSSSVSPSSDQSPDVGPEGQFLSFPRPYRTYVNLSDTPLDIPKSDASVSSRASSPMGRNDRFLTESITGQYYNLDPLNFNGSLPITTNHRFPVKIAPVASPQNPQSLYTTFDLLADWESIYALFYHLSYQGFSLAQKMFEADPDGVPLYKTVFTTLARKCGLESDPALIASVTEFASSSNTIESNPNFYAFLSLLSQIIVKSLFVPLTNPLYVPLYLKSLRKEYSYLPKNQASPNYKNLDQKTLFAHLNQTISTLLNSSKQDPDNRLGTHLTQIQTHTVGAIESLFAAYNLPVPTHDTIQQIVQTATLTFLRMKAGIPTVSLHTAQPSVDIERRAVVGVNLDLDVVDPTRSSTSVHSIGAAGFGKSVFTVWPGLCEGDIQAVKARARVWVFKV